MINAHRHTQCPACTGHIAVTQGNTVLPDQSRHEPGCTWRPGMSTSTADTNDFALWEAEMQETQP